MNTDSGDHDHLFAPGVGMLCFPRERLTLAGGDVFQSTVGGVEP
jgi:hypothetical protein